MPVIFYYILKVILCSGILYGYYLLVLRNRVFHRWNRFFLLSIIPVSLVFPLAKINLVHNPASDTSNQVIKLLNVVSVGDETIISTSADTPALISGSVLIVAVYLLVTLVLLLMLFNMLYSLNRMIRKSAAQYIQDIRLIDTEVKGTPFSFFNNIFWDNKKIDIESAAGQQIFKHELAHVKEKHSADKLFINITLIFFWCNPFFWLIRRELGLIHEFIADHKAVEDSDTSALAAMILQAAYPQHNLGITNSFFSSSIKRRILMLTKMKNPKVNYISRILVLPLLTFLFTAFAIKVKHTITVKEIVLADAVVERPVTVVIDAGHGGRDAGTKAPGDIFEKDITLALAKKIWQLNTNPSVHILLTREADENLSVRDKVNWTMKQNPDMLISLHVGLDQNPLRSGFDMYIGNTPSKHTNNSKVLASILSEEIKATYKVSPELYRRESKGTWTLDAPGIDYPGVLIECGYMSNKDDLEFIIQRSNQEKIAKNILDAIIRYTKSYTGHKELLNISPVSEPPVTETFSAVPVAVNLPRPEIKLDETPTKDNRIVGMVNYNIQTAPLLHLTDTIRREIKSVDITKDDQIIVIYSDNTAVKVTKEEAAKMGVALPPVKNTFPLRTTIDSVLFIIDGNELPRGERPDLTVSPEQIKEIRVLKGEESIKKYNEKGRNGVVEITTKPDGNVEEKIVVGKPSNSIVFQQAEEEARFPGGEQAWIKYISRVINNHIDTLQKAGKTGTCVVQFIVDRNGDVSEVQALTMKDTRFARVVVDAVKNGPKWVPAMQNGNVVTSYRKQPVTFQIADVK